MSERMVILAPNWLGDAVMALPAIADVRRARPAATITIAARPPIAPLFALVDGVDGYVAMPRDARQTITGFDVALLLPNSFRTALDVWRAGVPERWGYRGDGRGVLLTRSVSRPRARVHQVEYYQHLVAGLGCTNGSREPRLTVTDVVRKEGAQALAAAGWDGRAPLVAIAPGAAYGGAKRWPPEYFAELASTLALDGVQTAIIGAAADLDVGRAFQARLNGGPKRAAPHSSVIDLVGKTDLPTLAGVLSHCRTLVTNDSGAMHLAAAAGVPVTAVFGPTRDVETRPIGDRHAVITNPVWCRPCMLRECPLDHRCLRDIDAATVARAARRTL
jgi:lipopolysaccharide heptosyltransferase II